MLSGYRNVVKIGNNLVLNSKKAGKTNNIDTVRSQRRRVKEQRKDLHKQGKSKEKQNGSSAN